MLSIFSRRTFASRSRTKSIAFDSLECRLAPAGDFGLAFHPGGPGGIAVIQAVTAPDGPVIVGYFTGTVNFNPSGTLDLTSNGGRDIFIASYDRMGNLLWAKSIGGTGDDQANAVVTDGFTYSGFNIYLTGSFQSTVNFNPGGTADNLTAQGTGDAFVASFDSSGNFRWADDLGGSGGNDSGLGIAYDSSARPYVVVSGSFTNTMNFYPSIPTAYLQQPLISAGGTDGFICKLVPDGTWDDYMLPGTNQTESWAEQIGGSGNDAITAVAASGSGYSFTGYFSGTANLNPHPGFADERTSSGGTDGFVMEVNSVQGYRQFLTTFGGPGDDQGSSITYGWDSNNSNLPPLLFVGGSFEDTVDFSGGAGTGDLTSAGGSDAFVARYNASTGALDWVRSAGGSGNDATNALAVAFHGVEAAGSYTGTVNFVGPSGTFNLHDAGQGSAFLWSLDANGNFVYARGMGGSHPTQALGVAIGLTGFTFVGGQFQGTADFNQGFGGTAPMTAAGTVDGFVAKFQDYFDMVPIAENDTFVYAPGGTLNVEQTPGETLASGFLADDQQRGGLGGLVPQILTYPTHGTLSPGFYGDFTYTPNADFTGTDSFIYQAADGSLLSNVATVTLVSTGQLQNIEPIPNLTMYPGQSTLTVVLVAAEGGSQANYSYSAQTTTQVPVTLAVNQYGVLTITPQAGYSGTFGVTASVDGSSETFNVHVVANTPPTLPTTANQSTPINTPLTLTLAATDPDEGGNSPAGQTLTYSAAIVGSSPPVTLGIVLNQLTITPATGYEGTFTVQASVTDGVATIMKSFLVSVGASTASFVGADTSTKGNWIGVYGKQGYNVLGSTVLNPAGATVTPAGQQLYTWATPAPTVTQALEVPPSGSTRVAAVWYSPTSFTIDVNVAAGNSYDLELYFLDYDARGRAETVTLSDANTSVVLNTQTVSNFANGEYLSWAISGNVLITITRTAGANDVVSGLFFDPLGTVPPPPPPPTATASFVGTNTSTQGTWIGTYGAQGYDIVSGSVSLPSGDTVTPAGQATYAWTTTSTDPRALQVPGSSNRVAAVWYASTSFTVAVNLGDGLAHNLELYFDDWDNKGRAETVQLSDAATGKVLDTETISAFNNGVYLDWKVSGNLRITITRTAGANAVLNGVFLDGTTHPASATFLQKDTTTQGSWMGTYGAQGYDIVSGPVSLPSGDTVTPAGQATYAWTTTSTDPRALQVPGSSNRVAAVWYASTSFTVAVNLGDGLAHNLELYFDDWDNKGRAETVQLSDAATGKVLDSETISAFNNGVYLDWKVSGNLLITITRTAGANAVLNGVFLDGMTPSGSAIQTAAASGGEAGVPISVSTANRPIVGRASIGYPSRSAGGLVDVVLGALAADADTGTSRTKSLVHELVREQTQS